MTSTQVLPKELRLSAPPTMPQARSYLFKQQSQNSTYSPGSTGITVQINIPRLQRSYLTKDSYLKFRVTPAAFTVGTSDGLFLDPVGAFGFFDKIEVYDYLGSTLLESTSQLPPLLSTLMDVSVNPNELGFHYGVTCGTSSASIMVDTFSNGVLYNTGAGTSNRFDSTSLTTLSSSLPYLKLAQYGPVAGAKISGSTFAAGDVNLEYAIPLFSFLGTLSTKFIPLHNGFTIQLNLANAYNVWGAAGLDGSDLATTIPADYTMSNIYLCCQILELGPQAESMLINSAGGKPLVVPTKAFRNFSTSLAAQSTSFKLDLNLNVASLTNILWIMRPNESVVSTPELFKTYSSRVRNYLQSWYFQYGSSVLPQTSGITATNSNATITNGGHDECYLELIKSRHSLNADAFHTCIRKNDYVIDAHNAANAALCGTSVLPHGRFAAGLDLELVAGRSQNLICGMNTNGMNTSIFGTMANTSKNVRLDCWAEYDSFINITPGIATTVSF